MHHLSHADPWVGKYEWIWFPDTKGSTVFLPLDPPPLWSVRWDISVLVQFKPTAAISDALLRGRADQLRAGGSFYGLIRPTGLLLTNPIQLLPQRVRWGPRIDIRSMSRLDKRSMSRLDKRSMSRLQVLPNLYRIVQWSQTTKRKYDKQLLE
jgi:hypothetical protein